MRKLLSLLLLIFITTAVSAQKDVDLEEEDVPFWERVYVGGGLGFSSSNYQTTVSLSPIVGYMITSNWSAGFGVTYQYVKIKPFDLSDNLYGGMLFTRYNINQFFAQTEYDYINYDANILDSSDERAYATRLLLGGGISQPIGNRGAINLMALYDLTYDNAGPYDSPWVFRVFFSF